MNTMNIVKKWTDYATKNLVGRKIVSARYMSQEETDAVGWDRKALVLQLDDGTIFFPSADDEGNDAGALFGQKGQESLTFPVI